MRERKVGGARGEARIRATLARFAFDTPARLEIEFPLFVSLSVTLEPNKQEDSSRLASETQTNLTRLGARLVNLALAIDGHCESIKMAAYRV